MITHRHLCPRHCDHSQFLSLSLLSFSRCLASLSGGVWPRSLCLVRVPYIRTRTSVRLFLSLSLAFLSRRWLSLSSRGTSLSLSLSLDVPLVSSLVSLVLRLGARPPFSLFTSPLSRLASIAGQPTISGVASICIEYRRYVYTQICFKQNLSSTHIGKTI